MTPQTPLPEHLSFSQASGYGTKPGDGCPRRYFLSRVKGAPATPAWYFLTGSAIHEGIEQYISSGQKANPIELLNAQAGSALEAEPDLDKWLHGGSKDEPIIKDRALKLVKDCLETAYTFLLDFKVTAMEVDVSASLPGVKRPIKGFVDAFGEHNKHGLTMVDWKSSSSKPKDNFQLETYRALSLVRGEYTDYDTGLWVMLRPGVSKARKIDLSKVTPESVGAKYAAVEARIDKRLWPANPGFGCNFCEQKLNCSVQSGRTARTIEWDTSNSDGIPY